MDACSHRRGERGQREGRAPLGRSGTALGRAVASKERCRVVSRRPFSERSRSLVREAGSSSLARSVHSSEVVVLELEYDDYCELAGLIEGECRAASDRRRPVHTLRRVAGSLRRVADGSSACRGLGTTLRRGPGPTPSREPETPPGLPRRRPDGPRSDRSRARWSGRTSRGREDVPRSGGTPTRLPPLPLRGGRLPRPVRRARFGRFPPCECSRAEPPPLLLRRIGSCTGARHPSTGSARQPAASPRSPAVSESTPLHRLSGAWRLGTWRLSNSRAPAAA